MPDAAQAHSGKQAPRHNRLFYHVCAGYLDRVNVGAVPPSERSSARGEGQPRLLRLTLL